MKNIKRFPLEWIYESFWKKQFFFACRNFCGLNPRSTETLILANFSNFNTQKFTFHTKTRPEQYGSLFILRKVPRTQGYISVQLLYTFVKTCSKSPKFRFWKILIFWPLTSFGGWLCGKQTNWCFKKRFPLMFRHFYALPEKIIFMQKFLPNKSQVCEKLQKMTFLFSSACKIASAWSWPKKTIFGHWEFAQD